MANYRRPLQGATFWLLLVLNEISFPFPQAAARVSLVQSSPRWEMWRANRASTPIACIVELLILRSCGDVVHRKPPSPTYGREDMWRCRTRCIIHLTFGRWGANLYTNDMIVCEVALVALKGIYHIFAVATNYLSLASTCYSVCWIFSLEKRANQHRILLPVGALALTIRS